MMDADGYQTHSHGLDRMVGVQRMFPDGTTPLVRASLAAATMQVANFTAAELASMLAIAIDRLAYS